MAKSSSPSISSLLPDPADINAVAASVDFKNLDKAALRRVKVRELMQMGYNISQIVLILEKGIKIGKGDEEQTTKIACTRGIITRDIQYIKTELMSTDDDMLIKRGELLDKLGYLYNQAVSNYASARGAVKNSFLNTALNVINKIMEVEGVRSPENLNINLTAEAKIAQFSAAITKLNEHDKSIILTAIRKVREQRLNEGDGGTGVPDREPEVRVSSSDNEGVPGKS